MANSPAFQFYVKDWLSSERTRSMSLAARGAYIDLLAYAWQAQPQATLVNNPDMLRRLVGADKDEWPSIWEQVGPCFEIDGDRLINRRMQADATALEAFRKERSESGRRGALAKHGSIPSSATGSAAKEPLALAGSASASSESAETDSVKENKPSQFITESGKNESACSLNGSQSQLQNKPDSVAPPIQSTGLDRFALATAALEKEEPPQENPIAWGQRMVSIWKAIRLEKKYYPSEPEEVSSQDFQKLISPRWLIKAGFTQPLSRTEIQLCIQWALRTSTHWSKRNMLLGSAGFVNAFGAIKRQCFNYHAAKETRNLQIRKNEENAHPALQEKPQHPVTVVQPGLPDDNAMKGTLQELHDMRTDSAAFPLGSPKWKGARYRELIAEGESPMGAENRIGDEIRTHDANSEWVGITARARGPLSSGEIQSMLSANKVKGEELSNVADL